MVSWMFNSVTNIFNSSSFRNRGVPDVPQDVNSIMEHLNDPNYDYRSELDTQGNSLEYDNESPYPEVRATVSSIDDPTIPVNTFRTWFLGLFFTIVLSSINQIMTLRYPSVFVSVIFSQLTALPLGKVLERVLPTTRFRTFGYTWTLNPGPFNIKEHTLISVMADIGVNGAYASDIVVSQRLFYNNHLGKTYEILLVLSTQMIGFSMGGFLRRFLVYPSSMIWPDALVYSAILNTLHRSYEKPDKRHISRQKFFAIVIGGSFLWYFVPGYLWTGLSVFNWVCWIAPTNVTVNALFGTSTGLGMGIFTLDWSMVSYITSPLISPWWSEVNMGVGFIICIWIIVPILYFTNSFWMSYLPISSSSIFDNTGIPYDPTKIITNGVFDNVKYETYSPAFIPATFAVAYGSAFASITSISVHTFLWYRRDILQRFRHNLKDERDVHSRLMQAYSEVPQWWYATLGATMLGLLFVAVEIYPTQLPIWGVCIAFTLGALMSIPVGIIQAIANQQIGLTVMYELVASYIFPGKPVAVMIFKATALSGSSQSVDFAGDLKLGHYMKIPPRLMFIAQVTATLITCIIITLVQDWMFANVVDICQPHQPQFFTCASSRVFATSSLIWGGIGPQRIFSAGTIYSPIKWFFLVGAVLPIPCYYLARRFPLSYWRYINIPVLFIGGSEVPPAAGINLASWLLVGFIFQWFMRRYHFRWWMRYNYILAAGLDAGVAIGTLVIFFTLQIPKGGINLNWWGNNAWQNTADALGTPLLTVPAGQKFGPSTW